MGRVPEKKLVLVAWGDAWATLEDFDEAEHEPYVYRTPGWLVRRDKDGITLAWDLGADGDTRGEHFIPAGMVVSVKDL